MQKIILILILPMFLFSIDLETKLLDTKERIDSLPKVSKYVECFEYRDEATKFFNKVSKTNSNELKNRYLDITNKFLNTYYRCIDSHIKNETFSGYRLNPLLPPTQ